ncbi:MAG: hypothetical protein CMD16_01545 [Flavobacteriales bacterium]|nr:hypothetical protein [Flavobacteriales bacterium]|tara:strand:- start:3154 stop:3876 length:723 start_codon:yes stop_codon:yes gene_type:complete
MKKITLLIFITFISLGMFAQSLLPTKYGIKLGANIANVSSTANEDVKNIDNSALVGIAGGFYMEIALNDKWYINPELVYVQKGVLFDYDFTHIYENTSTNQAEKDEHNTSNELKLAYIELNPTISYKTPYKIALNFGPSLSFLIEDEYIMTDTGDDDALQNHEVLKEGVFAAESFDVGLNLGLSYYISENLIIDGKVNRGFMSIGKVAKETNTGSDGNEPRESIFDLKSKGIVFSVAYLF